jgi:hypothetical protein
MKEMKNMDIDKKVNKLRLDILNLETELFRMLHPKDENEESFLPKGNEILFNFKKARYENMMDNISYSINDLKNIKKLAEQINQIKK